MSDVHFSVDSHLLRELGDRLVGRPHIALAELIKNAYDADATRVDIRFGSDSLTITDNGHGMSRSDFEQRWMRIGSIHKENERVSPILRRPLTGSKGVGRLSVQLLADQLELRSRTAARPGSEIRARVDWTRAVEAGLLTTATADVTRVKSKSDPNRTSGVSLRLTGLHQQWTRRDIEKLGEQIWPLRPPFRTDDERDFTVHLEGEAGDDDFTDVFDRQMTAVLELWSAKLEGRLLDSQTEPNDKAARIVNPDARDTPTAPTRTLQLKVEMAGAEPVEHRLLLDDCHLDRLKFEIRVFNLRNRQPHGIAVGDARRYLNDYGGVHVYDAGFHLPYYGPEADWLRIEKDHAHRRGASDYLPKSLQVSGGAEYLPTNSRLFGTVEVNTTHELAQATKKQKAPPRKDQGAQIGANPREALRIQVTRDRLVDTTAYRNLVTLVRSAVDIYAMTEARRALQAAQTTRETSPPSPRAAQTLTEALERHREEIPPPVYDELVDLAGVTSRALSAEYEERKAQTGLLASLATAGVSAMAYEHEVGKQFLVLERVADDLRRGGRAELDQKTTADTIDSWLQRARATRALFSPLLEARNREVRARLKARETVRGVFDQVAPLMRGTELVNSVASGLRLPAGTYAEWSALFQNLLINASNAMLDSDERTLEVSGGSTGDSFFLDVQDTGVGIDLAEAPRYFEPFRRESRVSAVRAELGLGGTGLGLTIVAMLADELGCDVTFVEPGEGFSTCARISWEESE